MLKIKILLVPVSYCCKPDLGGHATFSAGHKITTLNLLYFTSDKIVNC